MYSLLEDSYYFVTTVPLATLCGSTNIQNHFQQQLNVCIFPVQYITWITLILHSNTFCFFYSLKYCPCNVVHKVENRVRILADLKELASAESLDSFTFIYTNIEHHPIDHYNFTTIIIVFRCLHCPFSRCILRESLSWSRITP